MTAFANRHGTGSFRRRHLLVALDDRTVAAGLEDEMHHFELRVHHDGERVTAVDGFPIRWPWTPCFDAPEALTALAGLPLHATPAEVARFTDVREQCTHNFDLAVLAAAHASRVVHGGARRRDYVTEVPDWEELPVTGRLWRDGELLLDWLCDYETVLEPEAFRGLPTRSGFFHWCAAHLDDELTEAAQVLRRSVWMSPARKLDLEDYDDATQGMLKPGICYTGTPERMPVAFRNRGSLRNYSVSAAELLAGFDERHPTRH
jgi:hypothetical protein